METGWKTAVLILLVIIVGSWGGKRVMNTPRPAVATAKDIEDAAAAAAEAKAASLAAEPFTAVSYEIQACVDDKATLYIQGDKIMWNELTGEGLGAASCSPATRNKTTVIARSTLDNSSESLTIDSPRTGEYYGSLKTPLPSKELLVPAEIQILYSDNTSGLVTVVEQPTGPGYRARVAFNDAKAYAHEYDVLLVLKYRPAAGAVAR